MFLFASAIKITVSISSTKSRIFASIKTSEPKTSLKAWRLLLPASLFGLLMNHSAQLGCFCVVIFLTFKNYSLIRLLGLVARPVQSKSEVEMRFNLVFASPQNLNIILFKCFRLASSALSFSPLSASKQKGRRKTFLFVIPFLCSLLPLRIKTYLTHSKTMESCSCLCRRSNQVKYFAMADRAFESCTIQGNRMIYWGNSSSPIG